MKPEKSGNNSITTEDLESFYDQWAAAQAHEDELRWGTPDWMEWEDDSY
jgi:hypothetical protein